MKQLPEIPFLRKTLARCGYDDACIRDLSGGELKQNSDGVVAFRSRPFDGRSACIAVIGGGKNAGKAVAAIRNTGAPLVIHQNFDEFTFWRQEMDGPQWLYSLTRDEFAKFTQERREDLGPESIYRAKVWGRLESVQMEFVDVGLMQLLEEEMGQKLTDFMGQVVHDTRERLGWKRVSSEQGEWLLKSTFWLLATKILKDKQVPGFIRLDLEDLDTVFDRLARHYDTENPHPIEIAKRRRASLLAAAAEINRFADLSLLSTETLAYLYESALIDQETRRKLGTHSTPSWLIDYVVGRLRPWIEKIPVSDRRVFEPACGHAGFLIAAMRLLGELRPQNWKEDRRTYLRKRLRGIEIDTFAVEIARLSMTLADVPNPNGWSLRTADMFAGSTLAKEIAAANIVLANPPFEDFSREEKGTAWQFNKAAETVRRLANNLSAGGVFGLVLPQSFLHSKQATPVRRKLLTEFEIDEVTLFADKVFRYGDPESTVLIGRRMASSKTRPKSSAVTYQRVRENQIPSFAKTYVPSSSELHSTTGFKSNEDASIFVPELERVWAELRNLKRLGEYVHVGKGFEHKGDGNPTLPQNVVRVSSRKKRAFTPGFAGWEKEQLTHELPREVFFNLNSNVVQVERSGTVTGIAQVLLNYAPVSRGAWRLKALLDRQGHAVTTRFSVVRPTPHICPSLEVIWAICNSPIANAYSYCVSSKRDILIGQMRRMPVPELHSTDLTFLETAVVDYLLAAVNYSEQAREDADGMPLFTQAKSKKTRNALPTKEELKILHWRIDAEVMRLYNLPAELERKVLDLFNGQQRRGVPFAQTEYFTDEFAEVNRLSDLLAITVDWDETNARRLALLAKQKAKTIRPDEKVELKELRRLAGLKRESLSSPSLAELREIEADLRKRGLWEGK